MEKDEDLDIKKIDSFLVIVDRNTSRKQSSSSSWISFDPVQNSSILERGPTNLLESFGPSTPYSVPSLKNISPDKGQRFKKKDRLRETIIKCEQARSKCQNILMRNPIQTLKNRAYSNDRVQEQKHDKKGVRYLNYLQQMSQKQDIQLRCKTSQSETELKHSYSLPQLKVQPLLLTILNNNNCYNFRLLKSIGRYPKCQLYLSQQLNTKILYSLKIFDKSKLEVKGINRLIKQFKKQIFLSHPNIIKLHQVVSDRSCLYAIYEPGMIHDLASILRQNGCLPQKEARNILKQLCTALQYLHKLDILHLQLRLENIYLEQNVVKLAGFDNSIYLPMLRGQRIPGIIEEKSDVTDRYSLLDSKKDIWDIGIMTYELMFGKLPIFIHSQNPGQGAGIYFPEEVSYSTQLKDFVEGCLQQNPYKRFTMRQMNEHTFLKGIDKYRWTTF